MSDPTCTIEQGDLKGKYEIDMDGNPFFGFMGIPYAKAPLGNLRFKAPQPLEKWDGIRDATKEGNSCYAPQPIMKPGGAEIELTGSEDCLFLNVFTRKSKELKPVMVFIHGGGFYIGSSHRSMYGPEFLMTEDIVLVTLNYRLGALGFLVIDDPKLGVTGNAGLKDQVQALKWVQKNIKNFGGDPENVTIFGHSAGGSSCNYLMLSPTAKGLFHKAILQSGTALSPWARGVNDATKLAEKLGCHDTDNETLLKFLQEVSVDELLGAQKQIQPLSLNPSSKTSFSPTVEAQSENAFLCQEPLELMTSGRYTHVPLMLGYTSMEGIIEAFGGLTGFRHSHEDFVPYYFGYPKDSEEFKKINKQITQFYFGQDKSNVDSKETLSKVFTDVIFVKEITRTARLLAKTSQKPVYLYRVSVESDLNVFKMMTQAKIKGVCHGDDLGYLFKGENTNLKMGTIEELAIRRFVKMWANFARTGNPIPEKKFFLKSAWKPLDLNAMNFLDIGTDLVPGVDPNIEEMNFWNDISKGIKDCY